MLTYCSRTLIASINGNYNGTWSSIQVKCVVIHVTKSRTPVPNQYLLHGQALESVAGSKYLGIEISNNLSFNNHIQNITTSASQSLGFLKRNIWSQNPALRDMAYKTLVRPLVDTLPQFGATTPKAMLTNLK